MKKPPEFCKLYILLMLAMSLCACDLSEKGDGEMVQEPTKATVVAPPPLKSGQKLDPDSDYAKYWTGLPEWIDFNGMILKIPAQFTGFWAHKNYPKINFTNAIDRPIQIRKVKKFSFRFFMPDLGGYTPENYLTEFNEDEVQIISIQPRPMSYAEPGAPGTYPPNVFERRSDVIFDIGSYRTKYGLKCYDQVKDKKNGTPKEQSCYGMRDAKLEEYILLDVIVGPYPDWVKFPIMQTTYFTKQYGGLEITWRAHAKHFNRWQDIDHQIWQYIENWRVDS